MFSQLSQHKIPNEHPGTLRTLNNTNSCNKIGAMSYTLLGRKDCTNALLWSKITLTTGSVGGAGVDPPP